MPLFKPFKGIRPTNEFVNSFPVKSLDDFSDEEILEKVKEKGTYINMIKPYLTSKSKDVDRNFRKIRTNFETMKEEQILFQDDESYYLYEQTIDEKSVFRGLLGLVSIEEYWEGKIKKHESTITEKKQNLANYLNKVGIQSQPILLTYPSNSKVEMLMTHESKNIPIVDIEDENGVVHKIWKIDNRLKLKQFKDVFDKIDSFYIADGHHRIESTALNTKLCKEKNKKHTGNESYNFAYSFIVSNQSIKINDYNRAFKNLNGLTANEFLKELEEYFLIHKKDEHPYFPSQKFHFSMYLDGQFYSLHVKHNLRQKEPGLDFIDHHLLEKYVLKAILKIEDIRTSKDIEFVKGDSTVDGILKLKEMVDSGEYQVAFGICPVTFNDLVKISDLGIKMPPKSTLVSPKLMTALVMYDMK